MAEVVICDTNVVIRIAIVFPDSLLKKYDGLSLAVPAAVKSEISDLKRDSKKAARLGKVFDFILKSKLNAPSATLPRKDKEIALHRRIQQIEDSLPPEEISSGSSHTDRTFLILAKANEAKLCTNDKTLFYLSAALLGADRAWNFVHLLRYLLDQGIATQADLQTGLNKLFECQEYLTSEAVDELAALGFDVD